MGTPVGAVLPYDGILAGPPAGRCPQKLRQHSMLLQQDDTYASGSEVARRGGFARLPESRLATSLSAQKSGRAAAVAEPL